MKRNLFFIAIIIVTAASCVKDRIQPAVVQTAAPTGDTLMYYWSFNNSDSATHTPDFAVPGHSAYFKYYSAYIDYTGGSAINIVGATDTGEALRVRNPSDSLIFVMPTTGYDSVVFAFAEEASSSGSSVNAISYTTDGVNFVTAAFSNNQYSVGTVFGLQTFNFSADPNVNNNPKFAVKIQFTNNNTTTSGNDRFDNVTLLGVRQ